MKNIKKSSKIIIANLNSIQKLTDVECQQVYGGQGVIQGVRASGQGVISGILS